MTNFEEENKRNRRLIAETLLMAIEEIFESITNNPPKLSELKKIEKQINTLQLLIAEIYPEDYGYFLSEDYTFRFSADLNNGGSSDDI